MELLLTKSELKEILKTLDNETVITIIIDDEKGEGEDIGEKSF